MDLDQTACATNTKCSFGNLKDLVPKGVTEFCALDQKFPYPALLPSCLDKGSESKCSGSCKWYNTASAPTGPQDHCALKAIFASQANKSGVSGAGGVCQPLLEDACVKVDQCDWIVVDQTTPVVDPAPTDPNAPVTPVDPTNPTDPNAPVTPVDPTKPTEPVVAPVLPSDVVGKCTHTSGFNTDKTVTDMCEIGRASCRERV